MWLTPQTNATAGIKCAASPVAEDGEDPGGVDLEDAGNAVRDGPPLSLYSPRAIDSDARVAPVLVASPREIGP